MHAYPKVSIITVCYNACPSLEKTIDNVMKQKYPDKEFIIIDGNSTDGTQELIKSHGQHIDQWVSEPDKGIYDAMNKGIKLCSGEWAIFMNAGDTFASDEVLKEIFSTPHDADVIYGDVKKNGNIYKPHKCCNAHRMLFCHQSSLTKTACLRQYPFDITHKMSADYKFFKQMMKAGRKFDYIDKVIADYDTTGISNTRRSDGIRDNISIIRELDDLKDRMRLLPRLYFVYFMCRLRHK